MAYYVMEEMPDIHGTGERVLYPRLAMIEQVNTTRLVQEIAYRSSFGAGEIEGIIKEIGLELARQMAAGHSVRLDGIGTFTPSLALRKGKEREEAGEGGKHRNAQSILVGGVNFRVDKDLVAHTNERCTLERAPWKARRSSQKYTPEQRLALATAYLDKHPFLGVQTYQELTGLLHCTASLELRKWSKQPGSGIGIAGRGSHRVYIKEKSGGCYEQEQY